MPVQTQKEITPAFYRIYLRNEKKQKNSGGFREAGGVSPRAIREGDARALIPKITFTDF